MAQDQAAGNAQQQEPDDDGIEARAEANENMIQNRVNKLGKMKQLVTGDGAMKIVGFYAFELFAKNIPMLVIQCAHAHYNTDSRLTHFAIICSLAVLGTALAITGSWTYKQSPVFTVVLAVQFFTTVVVWTVLSVTAVPLASQSMLAAACGIAAFGTLVVTPLYLFLHYRELVTKHKSDVAQEAQRVRSKASITFFERENSAQDDAAAIRKKGSSWQSPRIKEKLDDLFNQSNLLVFMAGADIFLRTLPLLLLLLILGYELRSNPGTNMGMIVFGCSVVAANLLFCLWIVLRWFHKRHPLLVSIVLVQAQSVLFSWLFYAICDSNEFAVVCALASIPVSLILIRTCFAQLDGVQRRHQLEATKAKEASANEQPARSKTSYQEKVERFAAVKGLAATCLKRCEFRAHELSSSEASGDTKAALHARIAFAIEFFFKCIPQIVVISLYLSGPGRCLLEDAVAVMALLAILINASVSAGIVGRWIAHQHGGLLVYVLIEFVDVISNICYGSSLPSSELGLKVAAAVVNGISVLVLLGQFYAAQKMFTRPTDEFDAVDKARGYLQDVATSGRAYELLSFCHLTTRGIRGSHGSHKDDVVRLLPAQVLLHMGAIPFLLKHVAMLVLVGLGLGFTNASYFALAMSIISLVPVLVLFGFWLREKCTTKAGGSGEVVAKKKKGRPGKQKGRRKQNQRKKAKGKPKTKMAANEQTFFNASEGALQAGGFSQANQDALVAGEFSIEHKASINRDLGGSDYEDEDSDDDEEQEEYTSVLSKPFNFVTGQSFRARKDSDTTAAAKKTSAPAESEYVGFPDGAGATDDQAGANEGLAGFGFGTEDDIDGSGSEYGFGDEAVGGSSLDDRFVGVVSRAAAQDMLRDRGPRVGDFVIRQSVNAGGGQPCEVITLWAEPKADRSRGARFVSHVFKERTKGKQWSLNKELKVHNAKSVKDLVQQWLGSETKARAAIGSKLIL